MKTGGPAVGKQTGKKEYDASLKGKAMSGLALRVLVAGYLGYLAYKILSGMTGGKSPIPAWGAWTIAGVLAAVGVGFCVYAWRAFKKALKAAEISSGPGEPGEN